MFGLPGIEIVRSHGWGVAGRTKICRARWMSPSRSRRRPRTGSPAANATTDPAARCWCSRRLASPRYRTTVARRVGSPASAQGRQDLPGDELDLLGLVAIGDQDDAVDA